MEKNDKAVKKKNGVVVEDISTINRNLFKWAKNITVIDLSGKKLNDIANLTFPPRLIELNLSRNQLKEVAMPILDLEYLKILDLSHNYITCFDDTPNFCHTIEQLDLTSNNLLSPPFWIFSDEPESLQKIVLNNNRKLSELLTSDYIKQLMQFKILVTELYAHNCNLNKHLILLQCFRNLKILHLGSKEYCNIFKNSLTDFPCEGVNNCCDLEIINLCNISICTVTPSITIYKYVKELDLSHNFINSLPIEFCDLTNLEKCILSSNSIMFLPNNINKLEKLKLLHLDSNKLCIISEDVWNLPNLTSLDLYDNTLYDIPEKLPCIEELDLAYNYFDEPENEEYLVKKQKLRCDTLRYDGKKIEVFKSESEYSSNLTDDEELLSHEVTNNTVNDLLEPENRPPSSPENWDSDDYWIPLYDTNVPPPMSPWHFFVKKKIEEGNFCPVDLHPVSVAEKVRYERLHNPPVEYESDGQFDDFSDDDT